MISEEKQLKPLVEQWPHLRFLGLGFWWAWRWLCFNGIEVMRLYPATEQPSAVFYLYLYSTLAIGGSMLISALCWKQVTRFIDSRKAVIGFGLLAALSTILLGFSPLIGAQWPFVIFAICTGLGTSFLCLKMGRVYGSSSLSDSLTAAGISLILAAFLYFVGIGFPEEGRLFYIGALPLFAAIFFVLKNPDEILGFESVRDTEKIAQTAKTGIPRANTPERKLLLRLAIAAGLVAFTAGIGKGLSTNYSSSEVLSQEGVVTSLVVMVIAVLIILAINKQSLRRGVYQIYSGLMLIGVFVLIASAFGFPLTYLTIFKEPLWVVLSCFMAYIAFRYDISPVWVFGFGQATYFLSSVAGWLAGYVFVDHFSDTQFFSIVSIVLAFSVLVVLLYVFNGKDLSRITSVEPTRTEKNTAVEMNSNESVETSATTSKPVSLSPATRQSLGLSDRESEVMELFAQGRSATWIADTLMISTSTVRSHIRAVYVKTDVHSRQELLNFLSHAEG